MHCDHLYLWKAIGIYYVLCAYSIYFYELLSSICPCIHNVSNSVLDKLQNYGVHQPIHYIRSIQVLLPGLPP